MPGERRAASTRRAPVGRVDPFCWLAVGPLLLLAALSLVANAVFVVVIILTVAALLLLLDARANWTRPGRR